jgi:hypothetical protein
MTTAVEDRKEVHGSEDFDKLVAMVKDYLVGKPVLRLAFAAGGEFVFHLGEPQEYMTAKMRGKGLTRGAWQLRVMRTPWIIQSIEKPGLIIGAGLLVPWGKPLSEAEIEAQLQRQFQDAKITAVRFEPPADLSVAFSNDRAFVLLSRYAEKDPTKALWKLTTPYKMAIHVFGEPASCWSYLRTDVPLREG